MSSMLSEREKRRFVQVKRFLIKSSVVLVYVAGPFSSSTRDGVEANIRAAEDVGIEVARIGACPVIPHANTSRPEFEQLQPYEFWIEATRLLMIRCDAVLMMQNWEKSTGATDERALALELKMPVFYTIEELKLWLEQQV